MCGEYKKITKEDVDFPDYCYFFIKEIKESLEENEIVNPGDELELELETYDHPYCYEAFALVAKTFGRMGYRMAIPTFVTKKVNGIKQYTYKWKIIKLAKDGLPF